MVKLPSKDMEKSKSNKQNIEGINNNTEKTGNVSKPKTRIGFSDWMPNNTSTHLQQFPSNINSQFKAI